MSETSSTTNPTPADSNAPLPTPHEDDLDVEVAALLARGAQDMGEATETVQLDTLTDAEKRILLALLRERMGHPPVPTKSPLEKEGQP